MLWRCIPLALLTISMSGCINITKRGAKKSEEKPVQDSGIRPTLQINENTSQPLKIGAANIDSLLVNSKTISSAVNELQKEYSRLQNDLDRRIAEFQKKVKEYQLNAPSMTTSERLRTESNLQEEQKQLATLQQQYTERIMNMNQRKQELIAKLLSHAIDSITRKYNLVMFTLYGGETPIRYVHKSIDYTDEVIKILDEAHQTKKVQ